MEENKMNKKTCAFAILLCLALASLAGISVRIPGVKSSPSATLSLQPATITGPSSSIALGKTFNLTLYVANVTDLWSWKVAISWDPKVLNLTSGPTEGSFMGSGTLFLAHPTNYARGSIPELSDTYLSDTSISGSGILANLTFKVIGYSATGSIISISNAVMLGPSTPHNHIAFTTTNATFTLPPLGDLGSTSASPPFYQFGVFDGKVGSDDTTMFILCLRGTAPAQWMYLADLGSPSASPPFYQFFKYDGKVNSADTTMFILCLRGEGPLGV
jgi:hypothetical protein